MPVKEPFDDSGKTADTVVGEQATNLDQIQAPVLPLVNPRILA